MTIAILGASGLIGEALARHLLQDGYSVAPIARRFTKAQRAAFGDDVIETGFVSHSTQQLKEIFEARGVGIIVNCVGVLQDGPSGLTQDTHVGFVGRLLAACDGMQTRPLLIHISVPGDPSKDETAFATSKRQGEALITTHGGSYGILRPGFVVAPTAYGGGALMRAFAALPFLFPEKMASKPLMMTAIADICATIVHLVEQWRGGDKRIAVTWDVMGTEQSRLGEILNAFRFHFGGPKPWFPLPSFCLRFGALAGDAVSMLGWRPPVRSTAIAELTRGVSGDPSLWMQATGVVPQSVDAALAEVPATVQEAWFARLFALKAIMFPALVLFWLASGLIALLVSFDAAESILLAHDMPPQIAHWITLISCLVDIGVGLAIAVRRSAALGLLAGLFVSVGYMAGSTFLAPELWVEPLGSLVKTGPAMVLMVVALAILEDR